MLGFHLGAETLSPAEDNPKGYFENREIVALNNRLLKELHSRWDVLGFSHPCDWKSPEIQRFSDEALQILTGFDERSTLWAIKDPRICMTLPFWQGVFKRAQVGQVYYLHMIRHPLEVARSQQKRHHLNPDLHVFGKDERYFVLLWHEYHRHAIEALDSDRNMIVAYDELLRHPAETLFEVARFTDVKAEPQQVSSFAETFIEAGLHHHSASEGETSTRHPGVAYVERTYLALRNLAEGFPIPAAVLQEAFRAGDDVSQDDPNFIRRELLEILASTGAATASAHNRAQNLHHHLGQARRSLEEMCRSRDAWKQRAEAMQRSRSWRITAPVRAMKRLGSRIRKLRSA